VWRFLLNYLLISVACLVALAILGGVTADEAEEERR
jgi:hypothetical protein